VAALLDPQEARLTAADLDELEGLIRSAKARTKAPVEDPK